jgi:hypothetical protein
MARRGQTIEIAASNDLLEEFERDLENAGSKIRKGAVRALRRSLKSGATAANREIRETVNLKASVVARRIRSKVISERSLVGSLKIRDRRIELIEFLTRAQIAAAYRQNLARKGKGVRVKAYRRKSAQVYEDTFVSVGKNDRKWHVLKREGEARYPIYIQYGPNMTEQFAKSLPAFAERTNAVLQKNLDREIRFALGLV